MTSQTTIESITISLKDYNTDNNMAQKEFDFDDIGTLDLSDTITLNGPESISINGVGNPIYATSGAGPTITTGASTGIGTLTGGYIYTTNGTSAGWDTINYPNSNGSLHVNGDANFEGDIKIKGKSLVDSLEKIEEKLAILRPNEELEEKWEELRNLRNAYKELEAEIIEKEKVWNILKK